MSDQTAPEPTMEEILASIRRIISEDDAPQGETVQADAAEDDDDEDVLELTETVDESQAASREEIAAPAPQPTPAPQPQQQAQPQPAREIRAYVRTAPATAAAPLVSSTAATAAASAFGELSAAMRPPERAPEAPRDTRTLEDVARELLQPMLRQWLDDNLPRIVQAAVREEVERIARGRVG